MAKTKTTLRDEKHELSRRALIKWSVAAGAALGVSRSKIYDILERTAGKRTAFAAAEAATARSFHIVAGNGSNAYHTQMWPYPAAVLSPNLSANAAYLPTNAPKSVAGTPNPLVLGAQSPWQGLAATNQVTVFTAGKNETHTNNPVSTSSLNGNSIYAVASALQAAAPSLVPVVQIGKVTFGTAPGGATPAAVASADNFIDLFNSAASRAGGLLASSGDAALYKAQFESFIQLNRAANRSTTNVAYTTARAAAGFLGTNLASTLQVTAADITRYGIGTASTAMQNLAHAMIISVKAFKANLCNSVMLPHFDDDPHGHFDSGAVNTVGPQLKNVYDAFMNDLTTTVDDVTGQSLADDTVISMHGDTHKDFLQKGGWPDGTVMNHNLVFVYSAGHLNAGWYGNMDAAGNLTGFGPDGKAATYNTTTTATAALASIAYAIAKRDDRAIQAFVNGTTVSGIFGKPKNM